MRALPPTCRRGGTMGDACGGAGSCSRGMAGRSLSGGGAARGGAGKKPESVVGVESSSGVRDSGDFLL